MSVSPLAPGGPDRPTASAGGRVLRAASGVIVTRGKRLAQGKQILEPSLLTLLLLRLLSQQVKHEALYSPPLHNRTREKARERKKIVARARLARISAMRSSVVLAELSTSRLGVSLLSLRFLLSRRFLDSAEPEYLFFSRPKPADMPSSTPRKKKRNSTEEGSTRHQGSKPRTPTESRRVETNVHPRRCSATHGGKESPRDELVLRTADTHSAALASEDRRRVSTGLNSPGGPLSLSAAVWSNGPKRHGWNGQREQPATRSAGEEAS